MKQIGINSCVVMSGVCFVLVLSGCISVPNSPTPRFYVLQAVDGNQVSKKINITSDVFIGVGPVKIPEYQDRPQIVTQGKEKMLKFAQFDRWGESLDLGVARLIREDLTVMLPGAKFTLYPWNPTISVKYQVVVEIVQLDSDLDKDLFLVAQWQVIDAQNTKTVIIKRLEFRQPIMPQNYPGLVKTLSTACASLSSEIAEALATLEAHPKTKE
ncbi:MAG: PqiC family protein [Candidatus Omnitrophica bacterium]|nr:PqiC family protein [Candidatus Omnitrophota bacterium]